MFRNTEKQATAVSMYLKRKNPWEISTVHLCKRFYE